MMKKTYKKFLLLFIALLLFAAPKASVFAAELEVDYPVLPTGAKITPTSELTEYLKYVFDFGIGAAFVVVLLSLAYAGVLYFLSPAIPGALAKAKDRVSGAVSGLLILVLFYLIITTINPYLAIFKMGKLEPVDLPEPKTKYPGVTFYKSAGCSGKSETHTSSVSDLGDDLRNNVLSVGMKKDIENKTAYISILYNVANFWGSCYYVNPNKPCSDDVPKWAASASVHQFDFNPDGDGVYIFRKPLTQVEGKEANMEGGFLKISNAQIIGSKPKTAVFEFRKMRFTGGSSDYDNISACTVPENEQDCAKYNEKGDCLQKECPNLDKENISSIWLNGDYAVLLVYFAPGDPTYGPWTYCQEYASMEDTNKIGPQNIKWDAVRSRNQDPNWMMVIPIKR